jgi:hypothetical protein
MKTYAGNVGPGVNGCEAEDETGITKYKWKRGERARIRKIGRMLAEAVAPRDTFDLIGNEEIELDITEADVELIKRISGLDVTERIPGWK